MRITILALVSVAAFFAQTGQSPVRSQDIARWKQQKWAEAVAEAAKAQHVAAQQEEEPDSDDPHPDQPNCSNYYQDRNNKNAPAYHRCTCKNMVEEDKDCEMGREPRPGSSCSHFCRRDRCGCVSRCTS